MLRRLAAFIAAIGISALALPADAQLSRPISGATSAPHCTAAELAARTGACAALTPKGDEIAVVTNASSASLDPCGTSGPTGSMMVACVYSEAAARWVPIPSSDYLAVDVNAAGHSIINLGGADFTFGCELFNEGGKLTLNSNGQMICADDISSASGSGHLIQNAGTSLPAQPVLDMQGGGNNACFDDPGNNKTYCTLPGYTVRVASGSNYVGTITCPQAIPQLPSTGTIQRCKGRATSFGGFTIGSFANGSYVEVEGTYDLATPATTTGGFRVVSATFGQGGNCALGAGTPDCGSQLNSFISTIRTLATTYNGGTKPILKFLPGIYYNFNGITPGVIRGAGWTLDFSNQPEFAGVNNNMAGSAVALAGTASVVIATDPRILTFTGGTFCGADTCYSGDEHVKTGDVLMLGGGGDWAATGVYNNQLVVVTEILNSTQIKFEPALTSNITSQVITVGRGSLLEFDNVSTTVAGGTLDALSTNTIIGQPRITCEGLCKPVNPWISGQTAANGYRSVPLRFLTVRHVAQNNDFIISNKCGKNDASLTVTQGNVESALSSSMGDFTGQIGGCGGWSGELNQLHGDDPNTLLHGGIGSSVRHLGADFRFVPEAIAYSAGRFLFSAGNCSVSKFDLTRVENAGQLAWLPSGCGQMEFDGLNDENFGKCNDGLGNNPGEPVCDLLAARPAWIHLGDRDGTATDPYIMRINFANVFFWQRPLDFLKVDDTDPVHIEMNGEVNDPNTLFTFASNNTAVSGHVICNTGPLSSATGCDRPATGNFTNLFVSSDSGFRWTGRRLDQTDATVRLPLNKLTDDNTNTGWCLVSGGGGGEPNFQACPSGGSFITMAGGENIDETFTIGTGAALTFNSAVAGSGHILGGTQTGSNPTLPANSMSYGSTNGTAGFGPIFEGASANNFEGSLTAFDVTIDRTWTLPNASGTFALSTGAGTTGAFTHTFNTTTLTAARTYQLPDAAATILTDFTPVTDAQVSNTLTSSIFIGSGSSTDAVDLATGEVAGKLPVANIVGTPTGTTFLRGDGTWVTPGGSGDVVKSGSSAANELTCWTGTGNDLARCTAGATLTGGVFTLPAHATDGAALTLREGADESPNTESWTLKVQDVGGLTTSAVCTLTAAGLIPSSCQSLLVDADMPDSATVNGWNLGTTSVVGSAGTVPPVNDNDTSIANTAFVQAETVATGDVMGTIGGGLTIQNDSVDGTDILLGSDAQGDIMYYSSGSGDYVRLPAGTPGFILQTQGTGGNPVWVTPGGIAADAVDFTHMNYSSTLAGDPALAAEECFFTTDGAGGGFICEGTTGDTSEQLYLFPDGNGANTTNTIVLAPSNGPITFAGTSTAVTITVPNASFTAARTNDTNNFTGTQTITTLDIGGANATVTSPGSGVIAVENIPLSRTIFAGTAALSAGTSLASGVCTTVGSGACNGSNNPCTVAASGTASTDVVNFTPNADISGVTGYSPVTTGGLQIHVWPTADVVNFKVCNPTSAAITPGAVTVNFQVVR